MLLSRETLSVRMKYWRRVLSLYRSDMISYWPLDEVSGTAARDISGNGRDGTHSGGVTVGQAGRMGQLAAYYPGTGRTAIYSAGLNSAFNGQEFSFATWLNADASMWTDAAYHFLVHLYVDDNNELSIYSVGDGRLAAVYVAGGVNTTAQSYRIASLSGWAHVAVTVSKTNNRLKFFVNGSLQAAPLAVGTWAGNLNSAYCALGCRLSIADQFSWKGKLADAILINRELSELQVAKLAMDIPRTPLGILAVGDSTTAGIGDTAGTPNGYPVLLCDSLNLSGMQWVERPYRVAQAGITTAQMAARVVADIAAMSSTPDEILLDLGTNDLATFDAPTWKTSMMAVANAYHAAFPLAKVRMCKPWVSGGSGNIALMATAIDQLYAANTWLQPGINANVLEGGDDGATYLTDGTHPNHAGYQRMADTWRTVILAG